VVLYSSTDFCVSVGQPYYEFIIRMSGHLDEQKDMIRTECFRPLDYFKNTRFRLILSMTSSLNG
jgi:hypothetical protein